MLVLLRRVGGMCRGREEEEEEEKQQQEGGEGEGEGRLVRQGLWQQRSGGIELLAPLLLLLPPGRSRCKRR